MPLFMAWDMPLLLPKAVTAADSARQLPKTIQSEQQGQEYEGGAVETFLVFEILLRLEL